MSHLIRTRSLLVLPVMGLVALIGPSVHTQQEIAPVNEAPNPYSEPVPFGTLPPGRTWGALSAITIDRDGQSVWVFDRCGKNPDTPPGGSPFQYDSCANSTLDPILKFDASGKLVRSFGGNMFIFPHKIYADPEGNLWVADVRTANERELAKSPEAKNKGHIVRKFSPDGNVLLTIGTPGVPGNPPQSLTDPTSIVMAPDGTVFISEGHGQAVGRISVFTKDGKYLRSFGSLGAGPGQFRTPHDIDMDSQGRLFVSDRGNMRIQILDQSGKFIDQWLQFSRPSGGYIRNDTLYVTDSESNGVAPHPGWKRGVRIGSVKDGKIVAFIPDPLELKGSSAAEGIAVDAKLNVFGAEVGSQRVVKYTRLK
jgi:sugar lactone lactonase YvrE